jgi:hypothetical protein
MRMVWSSSLITLATEERSDFTSEPGERARSSENSTSSAVKGLPSWKVTFGRSLNSQTRGSRVSAQETASAGTILPSKWRTISGS